jgi:RNA polymerase sigma-70 factor (ECF subfamily)
MRTPIDAPLCGQPRSAVANRFDNENELVSRLRARDEAAFVTLIEDLHTPLLRTALRYVQRRAVAEEVLQNTWLAVLRSIDRFEGRSSLSTWVYAIMLNHARSAMRHEDRYDPIEQDVAQEKTGGCVVWRGQLRVAIEDALEKLPQRQREVVTLRDVEGYTSAEVCTLVGLSEANQRVLLHRARSRLREDLHLYLHA